MQQTPRTKIEKFLSRFRSEMKWLVPGLGVKRWILVILAGITFMAVGVAMFFLNFYRTAPSTWWLPVISALSLRFLDRPIRVIIFGGIGVAIILFGIIGLNRSILKPFVQPGTKLIDSVSAYRRRGRGPKIVVIGGGTGLATLLRGLKAYTNNLTAIVSVADDGGSSGTLRKNVGILPPGDIRNCLAALSKDEELVTQLFKYRFSSGAGLEGHAVGNLLITALADLTGSFEQAIAESSRVLAIEGRVLPATLHDVKLTADIKVSDKPNEVRVVGESNITQARGSVDRVWLEPDNPLAYPPTIQAILSADMIVIGPGSLYTSLMPNLLVPDIADSIKSSRALKFYVANIATQPGETDDYSVDDHMVAIERHLGTNIFDLILTNNNNPDVELPEGVNWVTASESFTKSHANYSADLIDSEIPWRHDSEKLARIVMDLFFDKTGPLLTKEGL